MCISLELNVTYIYAGQWEMNRSQKVRDSKLNIEPMNMIGTSSKVDESKIKITKQFYRSSQARHETINYEFIIDCDRHIELIHDESMP